MGAVGKSWGKRRSKKVEGERLRGEVGGEVREER